MKELDAISKMLDTIRKIQESTTDIPEVQISIKATLDKMRCEIITAHEKLTKTTIEQIKADQNLNDEQKAEFIGILMK